MMHFVLQQVFLPLADAQNSKALWFATCMAPISWQQVADRKTNNIILWSLQERRSNQAGGFICCLSKFSNSIEINKITSSVLVLRNILHSFPTTSVYALLQYLWEIGVQLASPAFLHHKSQTTSPVSVLWIFHDISIVCGWAVALFMYKNFTNVPRAPTASCMK